MSVASLTPEKKAHEKRSLVLEAFAPYRIVTLGHIISGKLGHAYSSEGITIPEWRVLAVVAQADKLAARDVVRRTPMDKMTVSRAVASLEKKSLVVRSLSDADRRVNMLSLSSSGRALFERISSLALDFEADLLNALSEKERATFHQVLKKLEEHLAHDA